jgi:crotonobetainyl-CoA:carnitine CoA-transferase CaiB-like acyl-CoA transferase
MLVGIIDSILIESHSFIHSFIHSMRNEESLPARPFTASPRRWIPFGGVEPKFWETFCRVAGRRELIARGLFADEDVRSEMRKIFRSKTR